MAADQVSLIRGVGTAIGKSLGSLPKLKKPKDKEEPKKASAKSKPSPEKPKPSASAKPTPRSKSAGPKKRDASFKDAAAAVKGGHITPMDAIQISPKFAQKYASKVEDSRSGD